MQKSNLAVRLTTAGVAGPLILLLLFLGPSWGWFLLALAAIALAAQELLAMTHEGDRTYELGGSACAVLVALGIYLAHGDSRWLITTFLCAPILVGMIAVWRVGRLETAALRFGTTLSAALYVGALTVTIALLRRDFGEHGPRLVLLCLLIGWMGDTGGYFFGRYLGKRQLHALISPKKTVAGLVGSCVFAALSALAMHFTLLGSFPLWHLLLLGAAGGALGQLGDLMESLYKRSTGNKDSGSLIPGHGGLLDRIDALLVVGPLIYLYALWCVPAVSMP
jgi:phosphatidate cytidylyltransferase